MSAFYSLDFRMLVGRWALRRGSQGSWVYGQDRSVNVIFIPAHADAHSHMSLGIKSNPK